MDILLSDAEIYEATGYVAFGTKVMATVHAVRDAQHEKDKAFFGPLLRGMLKITEGCGLMLEHKITDEEIALLKTVEEVVEP